MPKKNKEYLATEGIRVCIDVTIRKFLATDDLKEWAYPTSFTAQERAYIHDQAKKFGLKSKSRGKGMNRYLTIYKRDGSAIVQKDAIMNLTPTARTLLMSLFNKNPVTQRERQDCQPPLERTKDVYQDGREQCRSLGRLGGGMPHVPPLNTNKNLVQFRKTLPIYYLRDTILQTITESPVIIVSGQTGSGKTTQVPQYILEWHEQMGRPCRIICAQPRRISAVSVSERVAIERGEKVGHSIGYQIRLEGKVSPNTVLTYCTTGVLLRTLLSSENALSSVTHVILDEIHERECLMDFVLIVLKEALIKFRGLRLILMSATIDSKQFSAYFNNCPVISVPGKLFDVKEYFLEDILMQTGYMNSQMDKLKKELKQKKQKASELEKWTKFAKENNTAIPLVTPPSSPLRQPLKPIDKNADMDEALKNAWLKGTEEDFYQILYFIQSENISVDYQHSETGLTSLMIAAAKNNLEFTEELLNIGASLILKSSNNSTVLDWAKEFDNKDIYDLLQAHMFANEMNTVDLNAEPIISQSTSESQELLDIYHNSVNIEVIDVKLIVALITLIHMENNTKGSILVFLPGYEDIINLKEALLAEEKKLSQKGKILILMLHSNMQTSDQRKVFMTAPIGGRKIILSTNIAETSITIDDIVYVIDSGKAKEKMYHPFTGINSLTTVWISQSCSQQRSGRAGRTQPGICYHLFSTLRCSVMSEFKTPEILRLPLHELCLSSKLLAPPNTSIVDFLSKAIDPPSSTVSRMAVSLLKTIDALDTWEDLTDLGLHLLDIPLDPRYGKMLIYGSILKCLDPILTIVCCLSYKDVFVIPSFSEKKRASLAEKIKFAAGSLSDHMALLKVFQAWQEARRQNRDKQFCQQHYVNGATMEVVLSTRAQILAQLRASGFVKAKGAGDIKSVNINSDNWAVVKAAIVGGLYPNIARIDREHNVLRTQKEHKVGIHPSCVIQPECKKSVSILPTDWLVYEELTRIGKHSNIHTATVVSSITVAIFAGPSKIPYNAVSDPTQEETLESDSEEEDVGPELSATVKLDDWIIFRMDPESARLAFQLRIKWYSLLAKKLKHTNKLLTNADDLVISTIVRVLSSEEQSVGLKQPTGVGRRPYIMNVDLPAKWINNSGNKLFDGGNNFLTVQNDMCRLDDAASQCRYFVIKAGQLKSIEASISHKAWSFLPNTQNKILQAFKSGKTVILVYSMQGSGHFQGYAKLIGDIPVKGVTTEQFGYMLNPPLPVEWIRHASISYQATRHLTNPYNDHARVQTSRDGQELEPTIGEALCQLWENGMWRNNSLAVNRGINSSRNSHIFHNSSYKN